RVDLAAAEEHVLSQAVLTIFLFRQEALDDEPRVTPSKPRHQAGALEDAIPRRAELRAERPRQPREQLVHLPTETPAAAKLDALRFSTCIVVRLDDHRPVELARRCHKIPA